MAEAADNATDDPLGPGHSAARGRPNLGGDRHPVVPQTPLGTIEIPKIALDHAFYEGAELPNLHWGPGHWPGTALPGQFGNTVIAGHRVSHTRPFLDIDQLVPGDQIILTTRDGRFVYEVTGHEIVTSEDVRIADPTLTPTLTLMACHPKGSLQQRYVVRGRLIG
jgi:sortase A